MARRRLSARRLNRWLRGQASFAGLLGSRMPIATTSPGTRSGSSRPNRMPMPSATSSYPASSGPTARPPPGSAGASASRLQGERAEAERAYGEVLAIEPGDVYTLANRAEIHLTSHRKDAARANLLQAPAALDRDKVPAPLRRRIEQLHTLVEGGA